jgi:probable rRNA maturation factor
MSSFEVSLANEQASHAVDEARLIEAVTAVVRDSVFVSARISLAVVDDATMQTLNRQYLNHDWPTDVLSFVLDDDHNHLEGEIILSADTAAANAAELGCPAAAEQLLYAIHGALHLVGYRDKSKQEIDEIRSAETRYLQQFGVATPAVAKGARAG